jgi:polysaccharide biosynthesis protein PslG
LIAAVLLSAGAAARGGDAAHRAKVPDFFYGMGLAKAPNASDLTNMQEGGVETVRVVVDWRAVQPTSADDPFDWSTIDSQVAQYAGIGIQVVPQLISTPGWLGTTTHTPPIKSKEQKQDWQAFLTAAAQRYGEGGTFWADNPSVPYIPFTEWQIWNEMNSPGFWEPKPNPKQYAKLLQISWEALTAVNADNQVVLGGMFQTNGKKGAIYPWKYLRELYQDKAKKYFSVVSSHPYGATLDDVKSQMQKMRATIVSHKDDAALWVDEIGWGSAKKGSRLNKGLQGQAKILTKAYRYFTGHAKSLNLDRVYWYTLRDAKPDPTQTSCGFCASDGLFEKHGKAKPAWAAFEKFATK